jgi:uncharacterized protein
VDPPSRSALEALPIFPLPDAVLLPGGILPLHVFEPRYRAMTEAVLAGDRLLAVARLRPGYEADYHGRPPVQEIAGIGYVIAEERLPDGRFHLLLRGVGRVRIRCEHPPGPPWREVEAEALVDTHSARPAEAEEARRRAIALCDRLAERLGEDGARLRELARSVESPAACADGLASALVQDPDDRQRLLEALDPADRLDLVIDRIARLVVQLSPPSGPPN